MGAMPKYAFTASPIWALAQSKPWSLGRQSAIGFSLFATVGTGSNSSATIGQQHRLRTTGMTSAAASRRRAFMAGISFS